MDFRISIIFHNIPWCEITLPPRNKHSSHQGGKFTKPSGSFSPQLHQWDHPHLPTHAHHTHSFPAPHNSQVYLLNFPYPVSPKVCKKMFCLLEVGLSYGFLGQRVNFCWSKNLCENARLTPIQNNLEKNKMSGLALLDCKTYCKTTIINTNVMLVPQRPTEQNWESQTLRVWQGSQDNSAGENSFQQMLLGQLEIQTQRN